MTLTLDGFDILRRIGTHRALFGELKAEVAKVSEHLIRTLLTRRAMSLAAFRQIAEVLGKEALELVLESLEPADLERLADAVDPKTPRARAKPGPRVTERLMALAEASAIPDRTARRRKPGRKGKGRTRTAKKKTGAASPLGTASMALNGKL